MVYISCRLQTLNSSDTCMLNCLNHQQLYVVIYISAVILKPHKMTIISNFKSSSPPEAVPRTNGCSIIHEHNYNTIF